MRKMNVLLMVVLVGFCVSSALASTWTAEAYKDATGSHYGWTNQGKYAYHYAQMSSSDPSYAFMGWAAYELPADLTGATINSATLEFDVYGCSDANMGFKIYAMTTDWNEGNNGSGAGDPDAGVCYMSPDASQATGFDWPGGYGFGHGDVYGGLQSTTYADTGVLARISHKVCF